MLSRKKPQSKTNKTDPLENPYIAAKLAKVQSDLLVHLETKKAEVKRQAGVRKLPIRPWPKLDEVLLERLTNSRWPQPERIDPRYSRKTKRVTVTVYVKEVAIDASVPIKRLDKAIDRVCTLSDGYGPTLMLLDELLHARQKYGHIIKKKKKSRGKQSGRQGIAYDLQYAAAWTYCFIRHQWKRPTENRHLLLRRAELTLQWWLQEQNMVNTCGGAKRSWQIRLLTAFLVGNAYANERKNHGLIDPLANFPKFHADSFYRTYIQPKLKHVESRVENRPKLLDSLSNAYFRKVFYPRNSEASLSAS